MNFDKDGASLHEQLINDELCNTVSKYALLKEVLNFNPEQCPERPSTHSVYGDTLMESILLHLQPKLEHFTNTELHPTYSFYRVYRKNDSLPVHKDRPACEVSVTLCFDYKYVCSNKDYNWPLYLQLRNGTTINTPSIKGAGVIYEGTELKHWRDAFNVEEGSYQIQGFFHYVRKHGKYSALKYDCRPNLGMPISFRAI